jgi:hypothetical protein
LLCQFDGKFYDATNDTVPVFFLFVQLFALILKQIFVIRHTEEIKASLPEEFHDWLPPVFDARHVAMTNKEGMPFKGNAMPVPVPVPLNKK